MMRFIGNVFISLGVGGLATLFLTEPDADYPEKMAFFLIMTINAMLTCTVIDLIHDRKKRGF